MPNSASDAGNSEYEIRKKIVDSGIVDCMVSMPSNMFLTVTLPATLWFFDKQKVTTDRKDKILFIDARNTYHQVDRAHREWKEEHIQNLTAIVRLYRGENERYLKLINQYITQANEAISKMPTAYNDYFTILKSTIINLKHYTRDSKTKHKPEAFKKIEESDLFEKIEVLTLPNVPLPDTLSAIKGQTNDLQLAYSKTLSRYTNQLKEIDASLKTSKDILLEVLALADKQIKVKNDKDWVGLGLNNSKIIEELQQNWKNSIEEVTYYQTNIDWLQSRFPEAKYADVVGLCKASDKTEYVDEQDYSMSAARYVGVVLDDENITNEEFKSKIEMKSSVFRSMSLKALELENSIENNLKNLF
jgi:type I restriction enzyme M protein